ncbi:MAG: hypothetical protein ACE5GY_01515 [Thermodesulfobacteriota bacterium]
MEKFLKKKRRGWKIQPLLFKTAAVMLTATAVLLGVAGPANA